MYLVGDDVDKSMKKEKKVEKKEKKEAVVERKLDWNRQPYREYFSPSSLNHLHHPWVEW